MSLKKKSIHQLRSIAQGFGVGDIFSKDQAQLIQAIELKQKAMIPEPAIVIEPPPYDARLMTKPPSKLSDEVSIRELLAPHVAMGLHITFDHERWYMAHGKKTDEGSLRMPLRVVLGCANQVMK